MQINNEKEQKKGVKEIVWELIDRKDIGEDGRFVAVLMVVVGWVVYLAFRKAPERRILVARSEEESQMNGGEEMN